MCKDYLEDGRLLPVKVVFSFFLGNMNMNKILTAGLLAAVMSTASFAECGTHGFYVGVNFGADFSKVKILQGKLSVDSSDQLAYAPNSVKTDKSKTKFHTELAFGFDRAFECVVLGVDVTAGMTFGKTTFDKKLMLQYFESTQNNNNTMAGSLQAVEGSDFDSKVQVKNLWYARVAPRVGFMLNPEIELYATVGVKVHKDKLKYSGSVSDTETVEGSPKKVKTSAFVGLGTRYNVCPNLFVKAEYRYELNKSLHLPSDLSAVAQPGSYNAGNAGYYLAGTSGCAVNRISQRAHVAELGLGYRF